MDTRVRASPEQLLTLLEYMATHGDLARPVAGAQGRVRSDRLWTELTNILNAVGGGVNKTTDKWKKVWADWKSKTKKKALAVRQHSRGTGGGPASRQTLSAIEERLLAVMGALSVEGQASVEELGFNRSQSPAQDDRLTVYDTLTVDDTVFLENFDETSHLPSPPSPQPSTSQPSNSFLPSASQIQTPPPRPLIRAPRSSQGRQPAASSPAAPPSPPAPAAPAPPAPAAPAPPAPAAPAPPAPAAPSTPRRRRPAAPRASATPPPARRRPRPRSPATPQSAGSPGRPRVRASRRRQAPTPFERAASEFTAVELRRLEMEETRTRLQHERDMRELEVAHERNEVFRALVNVAQNWLDYYRSRDNTEPLNVE